MFEGSHARAWLTAGTSAVALAMAVPALAQTAAPTPPAGVPASGGLGSASTAAPAGVSAVPTDNGARTNTVSPPTVGSNAVAEIVVTAERRQESIQDTPVAVSAFSADNLKAKRLDGGDSLVLSVPNVNYSRGNFGGYNFSIRGIGTKLVTNTGDPGVSFNENELPITANHLGDADFFDVQRVEVLRGPQGTLFGRTATGGAVNVITNTPTLTPGGSLTAEFGNYDGKKITGFVNVPVDDYFQFRLAGVFIDRDGFGTNSYNGDSVDGRDLDSLRASFRLKFNDKFTADLIFESFNEHDDRNRVGKQLCIKDPGKTNIGGVPVFGTNVGFLSQGCLPGNPYSNQAFGTVNSLGTLGGIETVNVGLLDTDAFANHPLQNHNLHDIESSVDPAYQANENLLYLRLQYQLTDNLTLSSITGYNRNTTYSREDYNRLVATTPFNTTPAATNGIAPAIAASPAFQQGLAAGLAANLFGGNTAAATAFLATPQGRVVAAQQAAATYAGLYSQLFPGGYVSDPQVGYSNLDRTYDEGDEVNDENTEELRISSHFKGPLNFTAGAIIVGQTNFSDYYVEFNPLTAAFQVQDALAGTPDTAPSYIDLLYRPNGEGHNYYDSRYGDQLTSYAGFGEINYKITDDIKITGGFRYTVDHKKGNFFPIELGDTGKGFTFPAGFQRHPLDYVEAPTGRFNVEWTPHLSFTNQTLIYGTYSHGYKPGGFNTPCQNVDLSATCPYPTVYQPEYIDSFEIGSKNTALSGSLVVNLTGFYYMYQGYQISSIVNKSSVQQNIDADIYGAEFESIYQPIHNLTFNANIGYLHTSIKSAQFTDQANLTEGDPNLTLVKASDGSNCVVNTQALATVIAVQEGLPGAPNVPGVTGNSLALLGACSGAYSAFGLYNYSASKNVSVDPTDGVGQGVFSNLKGNQLPNSPEFTVSIGAQYVFELPGEWNGTIRGDYYWQDDSYSRVYNTEYDKLKSYDVTNATLTFDNARLGINVQFYVKNAFNSQPYTDSYLTDASSGLFLNVFTLDPRQYGVSLTKKF